jgi:hypothetical protein
MGPPARHLRVRLPAGLRRRAPPRHLAPPSSHPSRESDYPPVTGFAGALAPRYRPRPHFACAGKWAAPLPQSRNSRPPLDRRARKAAAHSHHGSVSGSAETLPGTIGIRPPLSRPAGGFREQRRQCRVEPADRAVSGRDGTRDRARVPRAPILSVSRVTDRPHLIGCFRMLPSLSGACRVAVAGDGRLPPGLGRIQRLSRLVARLVGIAGRTGEGCALAGASMAPPPFADRAGAGSQEAGQAFSGESSGYSPGLTANMPGGEDRVRSEAARSRDPDWRTPPALPPKLRECAHRIGARKAAAGRGRVSHDRVSGRHRIDFSYADCACAPCERNHPIACAEKTGRNPRPRNQSLGRTRRSANLLPESKNSSTATVEP